MEEAARASGSAVVKFNRILNSNKWVAPAFGFIGDSSRMDTINNAGSDWNGQSAILLEFS